LHRTGFTSRTPLTTPGTAVTTEVAIGVVATGANVEADATAGMVSSVIGVVADFDGAAGAVPHGAMVVVAHDAVSKFLMRPNSL
jgi:hypothetical protein